MSVDTKARKVAAGTHLDEVGSSYGGGGFFIYNYNPPVQKLVRLIKNTKNRQ